MATLQAIGYVLAVTAYQLVTYPYRLLADAREAGTTTP